METWRRRGLSGEVVYSIGASHLGVVSVRLNFKLLHKDIQNMYICVLHVFCVQLIS